MGHQQAYRVAVDGQHPVSKTDHTSERFSRRWRLTFAAASFAAAAFLTSPGQAEPAPFAGLAGTWAGGGTVTLEDGSSERIRCRATYAVSGPTMNMSLTCASEAYKFNLQANVAAEGDAISGNWSESSRGVSGSLQGRGGGGSFQVVASGPGFNANISLRTAGKRQTVGIRADSQFRAANISLSR
jgi:hypothetical protein